MPVRIEMLADNVTLINGDSRDVIDNPYIVALNNIDSVVCDPPYGIQDVVEKYGRDSTSDGHERTRDKHIANDKNLDCMVDVFRTIYNRFNGCNLWLASFYSCRISPTFFAAVESIHKDAVKPDPAYDYFGEMIWNKKIMGMGTQIRYQHENCAFFKLGNPGELSGAGSVLDYLSVTNTKTSEGPGHPHEKPTQVLYNICKIIPGKTILDPFMGTGSTGAAAVQLKRGFVGIELEPKYFEMALRKIEAELKQPTAFWEE